MSHTDPTDVFITGGTYRHRLGDPTILLDGVAWDLTAAAVTIKWVNPTGTAYGPYTCTKVDTGSGWYAYWDNPEAFFDTPGAWAYEFKVSQGVAGTGDVPVVQKTGPLHLDVMPAL